MPKAKKDSKSKIAKYTLRIDHKLYEGDAKKVAEAMGISLNDLFNIAIRKYINNSPFNNLP